MKNNLVFGTLLLLIFTLLLVGCTQTTESENQNKNDTEDLVIATVIPDYEPVIKEVYAKNYSTEITTKSILPNLEELSLHWHDLDAVIHDFLENNKDVDLIYGFTPEYLNYLVENGSVKNLSEVLDGPLSSENLAPIVYNPIKKAGNGDLYAISPSFHSYVLVYNKQIFKEIEVEEPGNNMTWEEIGSLSDEILDKSDYKGITLGFPTSDEQFYQLFQELMGPIRNYENNNGQTKLNNEVNQKYWELFARLYEDNSKVTGAEFVNGEVAMAILPLSQLTDKEFLSFYGEYDENNWGIAGMPIFKENEGAVVYSDSLFSISSHSENKEAIKFLEYVQGKEFAELMIKASILPTYWDHDLNGQLKELYGYDLTAAYNQPGALYYKPQFAAFEYNEIQSTGAQYFVKYMNENGDLSKILTEYENSINN